MSIKINDQGVTLQNTKVQNISSEAPSAENLKDAATLEKNIENIKANVELFESVVVKQETAVVPGVPDPKLVDELVNWKPSPNKTAAQNMEDLKALYQKLESQIFSLPSQSQLLQSLSETETALFKLLEGFMTQNLGKAMIFFAKYSVLNDEKTMLLSLFRNITGRQPVTKALFNILNLSPKSNNGQALPTNTDPKNQIQNTVLNYKTNGQGKYLVNTIAEHDNSLFIPHNITKERVLQKQTIVDDTFIKTSLLKNVSASGDFSVADMDKANKFIKYLIKDNIVKLPLSMRPNSKLFGVEMALKALKLEVMLNNAEFSPNMATALKSAVVQYISTSISQVAEDNTEQKSTFSIYDFALKNYQKSDDITNSIIKTIQYAFESFAKESRTTNDKLLLKDLQSQFFKNFSILENKAVSQTDVEILQAIKQDWNNFVKNMDLKHNHNTIFYTTANHESIWGGIFQGTYTKELMPQKGSLEQIIHWSIYILVIPLCCLFFYSTFSNRLGYAAIYAVAIVMIFLFSATKKTMHK